MYYVMWSKPFETIEFKLEFNLAEVDTKTFSRPLLFSFLCFKIKYLSNQSYSSIVFCRCIFSKHGHCTYPQWFHSAPYVLTDLLICTLTQPHSFTHFSTSAITADLCFSFSRSYSLFKYTSCLFFSYMVAVNFYVGHITSNTPVCHIYRFLARCTIFQEPCTLPLF